MDDQFESGARDQAQRKDAVPPDVFAARITVSREGFTELMQQFQLDVGCRRPHVEVNPDGTGTVLVYATEDRIREIHAAGYKVEQGENVSALGRERRAEVGQGDRFNGGRIAPRGLGKKPGRGRQSKERS
jgi:hypothetical protein